MYFNYKRKWKQLARQQIRERKIMQAAGMNDENINEVFRMDRKMLYRDARYYMALERHTFGDDEKVFSYIDEDLLGILDRSMMELVLSCLNEKQLEVIKLHIYMEYPLSEIARIQDKPYTTITNTYYRALRKMKNFILKNR